MDRLGFFRHSFSALMDAATSVVGMKKAVEAMTEAVDEALADVAADMCLHLPSLDAAMYEDAESTLCDLARMGYTSLEVGSYFGNTVHDRRVGEFKQMTRSAGLKIEALHLCREYKPEPENVNKQSAGEQRANVQDAGEREPEAQNTTQHGAQAVAENTPTEEQLWWTRALDVARELGCKSVVMAGVPPFAEHDMESVAKTYAGYFERVGRMTSERGMVLCFHPSAAELRAVQGVSFLDLVAGDAAAQTLRFQLDTFEALEAGADMCSLLRQFKGRVESLHLHDRDVVCESEEIDFERVVKCAEECGVRRLVIEQHHFLLPPMNCIERSLQNVMSLPSVKW